MNYIFYVYITDLIIVFFIKRYITLLRLGKKREGGNLFFIFYYTI